MNYLTIEHFPESSYACAEAINTLCTNLSFSGKGVKKIMITSCHASEGKSFLAMNIMRTMAKFGKAVALVDADLRKSVIVSKFGMRFPGEEKPMGLSHYLAGMVEQDDIIFGTNIGGAYFVPIGKEVANPLPLLNSERLGELLDHLAQHVDYVFVDAPPVGVVIDAAQIAKFCDGTLMVVDYNAVRRQELIDAKTQLEQTGCPILGTALNMVKMDSYLTKKYYYKSHYDYYYHKDEHNPKQGAHKKAKGKKA